VLGSKNKNHPKNISQRFFFHRRKHPRREATQPKKTISQQSSGRGGGETPDGIGIGRNQSVAAARAPDTYGGHPGCNMM
jgi:hypothetical protein